MTATAIAGMIVPSQNSPSSPPPTVAIAPPPDIWPVSGSTVGAPIPMMTIKTT